jgi:pimeloyl-ACP methyl ester carboxylesterase
MKTSFSFAAIVGLAAILTGCSAVGDDVGSSNHALNAGAVVKTNACFSTERLGAKVTVTGSVFEIGARTADKPVVLLLHGMASDRRVWDGGPDAPASAPSFARMLAKKGYVAITIDRPGYGESPYNPVIPIGNGLQITPNSQIDMIHDVVEQIHSGDYTNPIDGGCPSGPKASNGSTKVVLAGVSLSGGLVEGYAAKYDDIAAAAPMGWANQGMSKFELKLFLENQVLTQLSKHSYVPYYRPGKDGVSQECIDSMLYQPTTDPAVVRHFCANENLMLSPAGELDFSLLLQPKIKDAIRDHAFAKVPVFLVYGDHDRDFPGKFAVDGEKNQQDAEIAMWKDCGCDFTSYVQKDAGHINFLQPNTNEFADAFDAWLTQRGLGGKAE